MIGRSLAIAVLALLIMANFPALAQSGRMMDGDQEGGRDPASRGLFATGLTPVFPQGVSCSAIASPFGSPTRYDGSPRKNEFGGLHNGMDITLETGTPLLAVADGEVAHVGTAGRLVGNFIWIRFAPEATGLSAYIFAKYQHLDVPAVLQPGDKVVRGQTVGLAGNTGTTGGHYGAQGYTHLHINLLASPGPAFTVLGPMLRPEVIAYLDPMGLYGPGLANNHALAGLPEDQKRLPVSVMTSRGQRVDNGSKPIWPVACVEKQP
ncbi:MAG: M23 family metallopeptidase [Alphaproteobacteria bacterium]|nr:M23 family metallopeptidase [Alphaproteobacteria bacterium]